MGIPAEYVPQKGRAARAVTVQGVIRTGSQIDLVEPVCPFLTEQRKIEWSCVFLVEVEPKGMFRVAWQRSVAAPDSNACVDLEAAGPVGINELQ